MLSVVISVFMLGLAFGSWGGGRMIEALTRVKGFVQHAAPAPVAEPAHQT